MRTFRPSWQVPAHFVQAKTNYCEQQQMWVVDTEQGVLPIINEQALSQLKTKTRADGEEDDEHTGGKH